MKPEGGVNGMTRRFEGQNVANLGSVAKMKADLVRAGITEFGSGWCWLALRYVTGAPIISRRRSITGHWEYVAEMFAAAVK